MDKVRIGVIGCGGMARNHMQCFANVENLEFTAAADPFEASRKTVEETYNVKTFEDGYEMLDSGLIDAVFIGTPHYFHPPYAIAAFERGLHVLTEKPLAVTAKAAQEMIDAADRNPKLAFAVMFQNRALPIWREAKRLIETGELGTIQRSAWIITTWFRTQSYYDSGSWRATWKGEGGGVLLNQCPHQLDLYTWLVGMPEEVYAYTSIGKYHNIEVEDDVTAMMKFAGGATGVFVTTTGEAPGINRLEIVGDKATLIISPGKPIELIRNECSAIEQIQNSPEGFAVPKSTRMTIEPPAPTNGNTEIFQNFVNAILDGESIIAPGREGILGLELGNAMLMSGLDQKPVSIPTDRDAFDNLLQQLIEKSESDKAATV